MNTSLPVEEKPRKWMAVGLTSLVALLLIAWAIYGIGEYGLALFVITPLFIGGCSAVIYAYKRAVSCRAVVQTGFWSLGLCMVLLMACAMEGLICIVMALLPAILLTWVGSLLGYALVRKTPGKTPLAVLLLTCSIPSLSFIEKSYPPSLNAVTTSVEIKATPETVWRHVIAFPQLPEPTAFIFKTGIAYPVNATITGEGVGAVRHCNFNTGSFVEPVTAWKEARLLKFDVAEQPAPLKELSFWDVKAPHLHDYFVSKQGQFRLIPLPNGNTLLEGTTWYYHNIKPAFYWRQWSTFIIHKIHQRVLEHIKQQAEK
ncbi:SRPBCC family protein [uncultured Chitinophaga sp.]|jgi:Polyketide cyclase / dehydrase and lipid transport.|uniref:SRPBCC family protein n=1 Tax=uncultured Chitinophaga sp. TaxID=339340 RepID=UPI002610D30B|nr:SRPBCC family protein [uncultured Chitinophaga sp.]